jgi:murein DD-endopeptidase MepM/ murein hydrolase activator NlpD
VEEGAQVKKGDTLFTITAENTELDYEVLYGDEFIDPLSIIAAKG